MPVAGDQSVESRAQPNKRVVIMDGSRLVDPSPNYRSPNFLTTGRGAIALISENQSTSERWTYTVPTSKRAEMLISETIIIQIAATSVTTTDMSGLQTRLNPEGAEAETIPESIQLNTVAMVAGDHIEDQFDPGVLDEGDLIRVLVFLDGDAAGAARMLAQTGAIIREWDA